MHVWTSSARQWDTAMEANQPTQTPLQSYSLRQSTSMGSMERVPHPLSQRSNPKLRQLLNPPPMMLPDAIHLFGAVDMTQPPPVLLHADYDNLFSYFAYELLASLAWASTPARVEYFYFSERKIPCDNILRGEASQYASLLYNDVHPEAPMRVLSPYWPVHLDLSMEIKIQQPMPDELPVTPPPKYHFPPSPIKGEEDPQGHTAKGMYPSAE